MNATNSLAGVCGGGGGAQCLISDDKHVPSRLRFLFSLEGGVWQPTVWQLVYDASLEEGRTVMFMLLLYDSVLRGGGVLGCS